MLENSNQSGIPKPGNDGLSLQVFEEKEKNQFLPGDIFEKTIISG
jgi:hypothetical protein